MWQNFGIDMNIYIRKARDRIKWRENENMCRILKYACLENIDLNHKTDH